MYLAFGITVILSTFAPMAAFGQTGESQPRFEVTSVKRSIENREGDFGCWKGRFIADGFAAAALVGWSYPANGHTRGLPGWATDHFQGYDVEAKAETPVTSEDCRLMVRALLADRFKLKVHYEAKMVDAYALLSLDNGAKLAKIRESHPKKRTTINGQIVDSAAEPGLTMSELALILGDHPGVGRLVVDRTAMLGRYVFDLQFWTREGESDDRPLIFTALRNQIGLRLQAAKLPVDVLVIDHIEKPDEN
jgi:uncharacterized protein (TIGR03435 family)